MYGAIVYIFRFCKYSASHYLKGFRGKPAVAGPGGGGGGGGGKKKKKKKKWGGVKFLFCCFFFLPPPPPELESGRSSPTKTLNPVARLCQQKQLLEKHGPVLCYTLSLSLSIYIYICKGFRPQAKEQGHKYT